MRFGVLCVVAGLVFMGLDLGWAQLSAVAVAEADGARVARVARATDVVGFWQPQQHLYVKGDLGVSQELLDGLEQWLDTNAANWTVVLIESAANEHYTDAAGQSFSGIEAANQALGKGLPNQTGFGEQRDPRTGEPNGAILVLALKDRKLSYFGSDAQDKRGLGEENWIGQLDAPAIAAMRSGGRVLDAVKDTITHIDRQLAARITGEIEARKRQAAAEETARAQALEKAKAALASATSALAMLETNAAEFNRLHPELTGDLARPDIARLQGELRMAQSALERGEPGLVPVAAEAVRSQAETMLRSLNQYGEDRSKLDELASAVGTLAEHPQAPTIGNQLQAARATLELARREYLRGDSSYPAQMESARRQIQATEAALQAAALAVIQRRWLFGSGGVAVVALLGLAGLLLNRRRQGAKREAEALYGAWKKGLDEKNGALVGLLDRRESLIGSSSEQAADRYSGETLELSKQIIKDVDELFIMSACAGRILSDAEGLLSPKSVLVKLGNLVQRRRYRRALRWLRDEPVAFRPDESLELVVRGPRTERDRLVGDLSSYEPFTMSFNQLLEAFYQKAGRAVSALDQVASSLSTVGHALEETQRNLDQTRAAEATLSQASAEDGLFALTPLFSGLLPAAQSTLSRAVEQALSDSVGALRGPGALARQQAEEAHALVNLILESRKSKLPRIRERAAALDQAGLPTHWVRAQLQDLSEQASRVAREALERSVTSQIAVLAEAWAELDARADQVAALDQARRERSQNEIAEATAAVASARQELGMALGLDPAAVLREASADPSGRLVMANDQILAARAALERGDPGAARTALEAVTRLSSEVGEIVAATRQAFTEHGTVMAMLQPETDRITALLPEHRQLLATLKDRYAPSVLVLGAGDPVHSNANATIEDNIAEAETHLTAARQQFAEAESAFRQGRLLEAADLRRQIKGRQETAQFRLQEIHEKQKRLGETEQANLRQLAELETRFEHGRELAAAPTTTVPTQRLFDEAAALLLKARGAVQAAGGDPFQAASDLRASGQKLREVEDRARCDRDVFEEATRSLEAATTQLVQAENLARQSGADNITDSAAIQQAGAQLQALAASLQSAHQSARQNHGDWAVLDAEADRISNQAAGLTATLRGELEKAQAAMAALSAAARAVRDAGAWTGRHGVVIMGSPGSDLLAQARECLQRGQYDEAIGQAEWSRQKALRAVEAAEAEMRRRRRLEEEQIERDRRQREAAEQARRSSWGRHGSSSFGGGSSFSSGSGFHSSSFSSGSGFKTSSW